METGHGSSESNCRLHEKDRKVRNSSGRTGAVAEREGQNPEKTEGEWRAEVPRRWR